MNWQEHNHKICKCAACKSVRGDYSGLNHPNFKRGFPLCIVCDKKLSDYSCKRCDKCNSIYLSGKNSPNFKGGLSKCVDCGKLTSSHLSKRCWNCFLKHNQGKKHPCYIHGLFKYPQKFNNKLKESIRKRDNYICKLCNEKIINNTKEYFLAVHHIDYNKQNCNKDNLISLCGGCNSKVNINRKKWIKYFRKLINTKRR